MTAEKPRYAFDPVGGGASSRAWFWFFPENLSMNIHETRCVLQYRRSNLIALCEASKGDITAQRMMRII